MRILVTGGSGGIGRNLIHKLMVENHSVIAPRSAEVNFLDAAQVSSKLNHEIYDVIIHLAFSKSSCENTLTMMKNALSLRCKLFIHMSSWVVNFHAVIVDSYTKSKKLCEALLKSSNHNYVQIRPSLVIGNDGLIWQKNLHVFAHCGNSNLYLVGVDEICTTVLKNLNFSGRTTVNLYGTPIGARSACELFQCHKFTLLSVGVGLFKGMLDNIAAFAFLNSSIEKFEETHLPKECFTADNLITLQPRSKQELIHILDVHGAKCRLFGRQTTLKAPFTSDTNLEIKLKIDISKCNKFVRYEDGLITMEAGAVFHELFEELDKFDRTVRCVPEYTDLSLGASVTTQIHGSSHEYHTFRDQITHLEVWRDGRVMQIPNSEFQHTDAILEVTIRTVPNTPVSRHIVLQRAPRMLEAEKLLDILSMSMAPTVMWFIKSQKILIWHQREDMTESGKEHKKGSFLRRTHRAIIHWQYLFLAKTLYNKRGHHLLGSWRTLNFSEKFFRNNNILMPEADVEMCVPFNEMPHMLEYIPRNFNVSFMAFRSSPKGVWCEFFIRAEQKSILDNLPYEKHLGKYC